MRALWSLLLLAALAAALALGARVLQRPAPTASRAASPAPQGAPIAAPPEPAAAPGAAVPPESPGSAGAPLSPEELARRAALEGNQRGIEHLERGELEEARRLFEECRELDPHESVFATNLAEVRARLAVRDHESGSALGLASALEHLERAVELAPERADLARLLARWKRSAEAEKDFWRKTTEHFELSFDGTREELMNGTAGLEDALESAYLEFGELFGFFPVEAGRPRIRVVLYRRADFDLVTGIGDWAGGVFDGTVRVPVEDLVREELRLGRVLRHELVHAYVDEAGGARVPGWLNEGLAQWLEEPPLAGGGAHVREARRRLAGHALFPLGRLQGSLARWSDASEVELAYAQSLALVEHIVRMYGERVPFRMVAGCGAGQSAEDAFREILGGLELAAVVEDLEQEL